MGGVRVTVRSLDNKVGNADGPEAKAAATTGCRRRPGIRGLLLKSPRICIISGTFLPVAGLRMRRSPPMQYYVNLGV